MRASRGRRAVKGWNLFRRVVDVAAVVILAIYAVWGIASADGLDVLVKASGWVFGYSFSPTEGFVDLGSIGACIAFACLAFVFRYGQMLQAVSDDTV